MLNILRLQLYTSFLYTIALVLVYNLPVSDDIVPEILILYMVPYTHVKEIGLLFQSILHD